MPNYVINITVQGKNNASGMLGGLGGSLANIGTIAAGIISSQVLVQLFSQLANLAKVGLDSYANFERLGMSLESLVAREIKNKDGLSSMGEALTLAGPKAKELLAWVQELAIKSPFTQEGVATAFQMAMGYGFTADQSQRLTKATVDYVSATGKSPAVMESVARALGQIQAKGKLSGQEVMQLTESGVNVDQILSKAFGKSTAEIVKMRENGLIPANVAIEAIVTSMETDFAGAAERQATSFSGLMSSMSDIKDIGLREFFTGTFQELQPYLTAFVDKFSSPEFLAGIREAGMKFAGFVTGVIGFLESAPAKLEDVKKYFASLITPQMAGAARGLAKSFEGLVTSFKDSLPMLKSFGGDMWNWLVTSFQTVAPQLMASISGIIAAITSIWTKHGEQIMMVVNFIWRVIVNVIAGALTWIGSILNAAFTFIAGLFDAIEQAINGNWSGAWATIQATLANVTGILLQGLTNFFNFILAIFGTNLTQVAQWFIRTWANITTGIATWWTGIVTAVATWINNMVSAVAARVSSFLMAGKALIDAIKQGATTAWNTVITTVKGWMDSAVNIVRGTVQAFVTAGMSIVNGIKEGAQKAWDAFAGWLRGAISDLPEWVKKILGISSPSKVFADIGYNMMAGMAKGLESAKNLPFNAIAGALGGMTILAGAGAIPSSASGAVTNSTYITNNNLNASYGYQSESSLFDSLKMMQMLG